LFRSANAIVNRPLAFENIFDRNLHSAYLGL
jgi:hypothetical protein